MCVCLRTCVWVCVRKLHFYKYKYFYVMMEILTLNKHLEIKGIKFMYLWRIDGCKDTP